MKLRYITNTLSINADFERAICSNGEKADAALTLCIAPAYESGAECPLAVAYITNNSDPYPFAVQNDADEIFFGRDAFGGDSSYYAADGAFADWLTPKALRHAACDMRANDSHFLFQLADELERITNEAAPPDDENDANRDESHA